VIFDKSIFPFYIRAGIFFVGVSALIAILYIAQSIIVPIVFALLIAILLHPVVGLLVRWKLRRILAISLTLLITVLIIASLAVLLYNQAVSFTHSWPVFVTKSTDMLNRCISYSSQYLNIQPFIIHDWINKTQHELITIDGNLVSKTIINLSNIVAVLILIPVYVFVILYYQPLLISFIHRLFSKSHQLHISDIISQTKSVIQHYLVGLMIEAVIVGVLNVIGLLLLGIEYAVLLGVLGAIINVIPYLGGISAALVFAMVALVSKSSLWYVVYVLIFQVLIQVIDNDFIVPSIVASKVRINALFSIIVVLVGNALWGISGMFLSIPLLAIVKVIFDRVETMKPWGYLLGDDMEIKREKH
jgi:predicted PurR-regulated permease PerM